jgi:uncharacterized protein YcbX
VTVIRLGRYPVKSFQGETVAETEIGLDGMPGDRRWAVIDQATGKAVSAKREGRLLGAAATTVDGNVVVRLPDGTEANAGDPALDAAVQRWLGRDVRVERADAQRPRAYEMNVSSEDEDSPLVDIPCPPGSFADFAAVHVLTTASLRAIAERYPAGAWHIDRFRPSILVEHDGDGFPEDDWIGRSVRIGSVVLNPFMPTVRCAMTTRPQGGLPRDLDIAKTVNRHHGGNLGVYCAVTTPGRVALGDTLSVE